MSLVTNLYEPPANLRGIVPGPYHRRFVAPRQPLAVTPTPGIAHPIAVKPAAVKESVKLASRVIARRSRRLARWFGAFCGRDLASFFHRVRLLGEPPRVEGPLLLFVNHPSWWDAELFAWLAATMFADRRGFAPMDSSSFQRYRVLERFGVFPVKPGSFAGASAFLALAEQILMRPDGLLLVNIEGRFRDVRARPLSPMPGLAHLARRMPTATFVPMALDYVFWSERRPNLLLTFGAPIRAAGLAVMTTEAASTHLASTLEGCMSDLAEAGQSRDPARFRTLLKGRDGTSFIFDAWRRAEAVLTGRRFIAAHHSET